MRMVCKGYMRSGTESRTRSLDDALKVATVATSPFPSCSFLLRAASINRSLLRRYCMGCRIASKSPQEKTGATKTSRESKAVSLNGMIDCPSNPGLKSTITLASMFLPETAVDPKEAALVKRG